MNNDQNSSTNNTTNDTTNRALGHQSEAMAARTVAVLGLGLLVTVVFALVIVGLGFRWFVPYSTESNAGLQWKNQRGNPGVEANQKYDRQKLQAKERQLLVEYGWQDQSHTVARIPIERAIELMAERELQIQWPVSTSDVTEPNEPNDQSSNKKERP